VPFKRREEQGSVEDEREALRQQRLSLDELKRQLAERVQAVQERERELQQAITDVQRGKLPAAEPHTLASDAGLAGRAAELERRERVVAEREAALRDEPDTGEDALELERRVHELGLREAAVLARESELASLAAALETRSAATQAPPAAPDEVQLARIASRLAELKDAEKLFMRTRDELAARSEAVAARERLATQRERELDEREDSAASSPRQLGELEARLKRLEQRQEQPGEETQGFSGGFRKLQQERTRPRRSGS
jgi:uncharacterized protein (DUF3084 family)